MSNLRKHAISFFYVMKRTRLKYRHYQKITHIIADFKSSGGTIKTNREYETNAQSIYQAYQPINLKWHRWYASVNGQYSPQYIPEDTFYNYIEPALNRLDLQKGIDNKNMYDIYFRNIVELPKTLYRVINGLIVDDHYHVISEDKIRKPEKYICKASIGVGGGHGIYMASRQDSIDKIRSILGDDFLAQEIISQHESISAIHPHSVNTVRSISLLLNNKVVILSSVLRMGINESSVDNQSSGGISVGINKDGTVKPIAYNSHGKQFSEHPNTNVPFSSIKIPYFDQIHNTIKNLHPAFSNFCIISWDFAIGITEPILIEFNLAWQEVNFHQINNGPLFGDLTNEVLDLCAKKI